MGETSAAAGRPEAQPHVVGNDWPSLRPAAIGDWEPTLRVSVVVPAYQAGRTLPCTLASLSVQTYPSDLLEVIVVDDGGDSPLTLPVTRPEHTRVVRTTESWGRAHACHVGALAAEGEVLHWLDADMLLEREEVEAQLRWHHLLDYAVVLGHKTFVDVSDGVPDPDDSSRLVREGRPAELFADRWTSPHEWVEEHLARTDGLTANPTMSYLVHVGASASVGRALYFDAGGMDQALKLGEDVELGYRLSQQGAVFVPDSEARSWHLGRSTLMEQQDTVNRYNRPFMTDRMASLRHWRTRGRSYTVPWVEVVVEAAGQTFEDVRHSVTGALSGSIADVTVLLVAPWSTLSDERRSPLLDPDRDLRMIRAEFLGEPRVRWADEPPPTAFPATFRLHLPAGWSPGKDSMRKLAVEMTRRDRGLVSLLLPDGRVSRLERTSAFHRARRLTSVGADLDEVVDRISETWWYDATEEGFTARSAAQPTVAPTAAPAAPRGADGRRGAAARDLLGPREESAPEQPRARIGRKLPRLLARTRTDRHDADDR